MAKYQVEILELAQSNYAHVLQFNDNKNLTEFANEIAKVYDEENLQNHEVIRILKQSQGRIIRKYGQAKLVLDN